MPEHASRDLAAALFDQQSEEHRIPDWGGDELFMRMPRPRRVDDAPAPRFRPSLIVLDAPADRHRSEPGEAWSAARDRRRTAAPTPADAARARAERLGLSVTEPATAPDRVARPATAPDLAAAAAPAHVGAGWDRSGARPTKVITGRPDARPRPLPASRAPRRRAPRTPAQLVGPRPERIMAWAFALGLLLILIAISTADAATL